MRYVPTHCLREGMVVAKDLYGASNQLMLSRDAVLNEKYIDSVRRVGFNGLYIHDELSEDIEIINTISDEVKHKAVEGVKDMFVMAEKYDNGDVPSKKKFIDNFDKIDSINTTVESIVDELLASKELMVNMVDLKYFDDYTYQHSVNVSVLSIVLGISLNLDRQSLYKLGLSALVHDIGKVFVKKGVLEKASKLTDEEFEDVKQHSKRGYEYLKSEFNVPVSAYISALQHHEKYDGTGYPEGLKGDKISLFAKILAISDIYDALTSKRPYREAMLPSEAFEHILGGSKTFFDPTLVKLFSRKVAPYPVGTCVKLSNNWVGIVIKNYSDCILRPMIRIFKQDGIEIYPYEIDLNENYSLTNITIVGVEAM